MFDASKPASASTKIASNYKSYQILVITIPTILDDIVNICQYTFECNVCLIQQSSFRFLDSFLPQPQKQKQYCTSTVIMFDSKFDNQESNKNPELIEFSENDLRFFPLCWFST